MAQFHIYFDDANPRDKSLVKLIGAYLDNPGVTAIPPGMQNSNYGYQQQSSYSMNNSSPLNRLISEKEQILKEKDEEIANLKNQLNDANGTLSRKNSELTKKEEEIKDLNALLDDEGKENREKSETIKSLNSEIASLKSAHDEEIKSLNEHIRILSKKLEDYEGVSLENAEEMYFTIDGTALRRTNDKSAPYIGKVEQDGRVAFQFNIETGKVIESLAKFDTDIKPFCDVVDTMDSPNSIKTRKWGVGKFRSNYINEIAEKAQIILVKQ